jgi:hypothetical protein
MVMRNRHEGANTPDWWDDLPPAVQKRITPDYPEKENQARVRSPGIRREPIAHRSGLLFDLTRLGLLFLIVALANLLFLLIALSFLAGASPVPR